MPVPLMNFADSVATELAAAPPDSLLLPDSSITGQLGADIVHTLPLLIGGFGVTLVLLGLGLLLMFRDRLDLPAFPRWRK